MRFFLGIAEPAHARLVDGAFLSVNRLRRRKSPLFAAGDWIMDSGAFTEVARHGGYRAGVEAYASEIRKWASCGRLLAAVAQDWMCEPFVLARTGLTTAEHQRRTVDRYRQLAACDTAGVHVMPVLQGYAPHEYRECIRLYGDDLAHGAWVGVGSVCKRNARVSAIAEVLAAIKAERPDLRLHGFGLKSTALASSLVWSMLESADSMAWSFAARREGRNANDPAEGIAYAARVRRGPAQAELRL